MCTVTYIPFKKDFVFTSNRDEHISRADSNFPITKLIGKDKVYFPQDPVANGTWIAMSKSKLVCVLNGGFTKHKHQPPYRRSRGLIVLDRFENDSFIDFTKQINLDNIEPFTMIAIDDIDSTAKLFEFVWDGQVKHLKELDNTLSYVWSSSPLYPPKVQQIRSKLFSESEFSNTDEILSFHQSKPAVLEPKYQFKMKRDNGLLTMTTTQIIKVEEEPLKIHHLSYINEQDITIDL